MSTLSSEESSAPVPTEIELKVAKETAKKVQANESFDCCELSMLDSKIYNGYLSALGQKPPGWQDT